jgi:quercetin dioxygenase-like cupin family protein
VSLEADNAPHVLDVPGDETAYRFEGADNGAQVSFFIGRFPPGAGPPLHRHPYEETFVIEAGTAIFTVDGETTEAGGGQIVVVPAGAPHRFVASGESVLRFVSIHPAARMEQEWLQAPR